jgi:copper chaperone
MKTLKFTTNINCSNCIKTISPFLNETEGIIKWSVDTDNPDKILTVEGEDISASTVIDTVEDAGFDISIK